MDTLGSRCDDFSLSMYLNTEMELPRSRDTVLHFFEQISKAFPKMTHFYGRENGEFVLEEDKEPGAYRWMSLESRRIISGFLNPASLDDCHSQHELVLDLAPHLLSVSPLDCEALDVTFAFDFQYRGNHDELIGQVFARESKFDSLIQLNNSQVVNYEPNLTIALDDSLRLQCRLSVVTRTNSYQVRTNQFSEDAISVYFTIRQYWGIGPAMTFVQSYRKQFETGLELVHQHVAPNIVAPLAEAIAAHG